MWNKHTDLRREVVPANQILNPWVRALAIQHCGGFFNAGAVPSRAVVPELSKRIFPAKLLLFGEHVLLLGEPALAIPVPSFAGHWTSTKQKGPFTERLFEFASSKALREPGLIDTEQFKLELEAGLRFDSNIPVGYGLGSSGALCAAVYERFGKEKTEDLAALKGILAGMESFFHGNSSGIDPLTSYLAGPVLIRRKNEIERVAVKTWESDQPCLFLIDSGLPRNSKPLVEWFLAQQQQTEFSSLLSKIYFPAHQALLQAWLSADETRFWPNLKRVSRFQLEHFVPMIPHTLRDFWNSSLDNPDLALKICGAGGGGFVLGFAREKAGTAALNAQFPLIFP